MNFPPSDHVDVADAPVNCHGSSQEERSVRHQSYEAERHRHCLRRSHARSSRQFASSHDFDEYERLVEAARSESQAYLAVLLGGEAGLRCGEIMALEWTDIDLHKRQLCVARSERKGHVTMPKGGRLRYVPLTRRLAEALRDARHFRGPRVWCNPEGKPLTQRVIQVMLRRAARRANVKAGVHILRHTFCSHLAMRGAPVRAIQELAGHQDLGTTQRYMHLSPANRGGDPTFGDDVDGSAVCEWRNSGGGGKSTLNSSIS